MTIGDGQWRRFLARYSLVAAAISLGLPVTFVAGVGNRPSDQMHGVMAKELLQASRAIDAYRLAMVFEALLWIVAGGTVILLAGIAARYSPPRAALIAGLGAAQMFGSLIGSLRIATVGDLAARYSALPGPTIASFLTIQPTLIAHSHAAGLVQGLGFLLAALTLYRVQDFPRWIAIWLLLPGLIPLIQFVVVATGRPFLVPLLLLHIIIGYVGSSVAMALSFWRDETPRAPSSSIEDLPRRQESAEERC